jgi:hypothetical protein
MSSSEQLYNRLMDTVQPLVPVTTFHQLANWMWITVGILQSGSVALSQIATYIPGTTQAESRVTQIRRWLKNLRVDTWAFYRPLLGRALSGWQEVKAYVVLDGVMVFGNRWQIFRLSLLHGNRAIPLVWTVLPGTGVVQVERLEAMLTQAAHFLQGRVQQVVFLADRGFRDWDWAQLCRRLGWDYVIRITANTWITLRDGWSGRIDQLGVLPGQVRTDAAVGLTHQAQWWAHLTVGWTEGDEQHAPELLAVISSKGAAPARLREYGQRMQVEQSFRDDKSAGFDLEHTRLQHADRLERLLLAVALATLWCHELGEQVLAAGEQVRRLIDPGDKRKLSLFQLGLRWLKRCIATASDRLPKFRARLSPLKLNPVIKPTTS